jgi:hypothetical protein
LLWNFTNSTKDVVVKRFIVPFVDMSSIVARIARAQVEITVVFEDKIDVVKKETVKAVIHSFLKTNIEELSTIERPEMAAFLKLTKLFLLRFV